MPRSPLSLASRSLLPGLVLALLTPACVIEDKGVACTDMAAASVGVSVETADGGPLDGLSLTYTADGRTQPCEDVGGDWVCGYEVAGEIEVTATLPGYLPQTQSVTVDSDVCHVIEEHLAFVLEPDTACADVAYNSVIVHLSGSSGEALESPAVTWSADGSAPAACETEDGGLTWGCAWEVPGEFVLAATASGHTPAEATATVPMTADGCNVVTQEVDIALDWGAD